MIKTVIKSMCVALAAVLLFTASTMAQDAAPETVPDGLDLGTETYKNPATRPDAGWRDVPDVFKRVQTVTEACFSACHGPDKRAEDPSIPNIAGQRFYYIRKQLETFNENNAANNEHNIFHWDGWVRSNFYMNEITAKVHPRLFPFVADLLSSMDCTAGGGGVPQGQPPEPPQNLDKCVSCHSLDGFGQEPNVPNLAGQSYPYLRDQLFLMRKDAQGVAHEDGDEWRTKPLAPVFIENLADREVRQLTRYYSALDCRGDAQT